MAKMGGARTFFTVYASIKSEQILDDANALGAVMTAVFTDAIEGMMIAFEEVFMGIQQWNDALMDLAEPIEMARIHFEKFFDENIDEAEALERQIIGIGAAFNQSAAESLEAAATMKQLEMQVGGDPAQMAVTTGSMLLGAVGLMETDAAMQALMQLQMQTGFLYSGISDEKRAMLTEEEERIIVLENTIRLVDRLNEVENTSGATIQGMIQALNQYASAATLVNTSLDEQIALGATLIEQGEQSSKAGRSIKQMLARLASDRSQNNAVLAEYNVQVKDEAGNMFTLMEVMSQLEPQWDGLSSSQQTNIAIAVAGAHHYVRFIKLMEGYDRAVQIMESSQSSANSALEEFDTFQENAMYNIQQYQRHIEELQYEMAKKLIPTNLDLVRIQYMQAQAQNNLMDNRVIVLAQDWLLVAGAVYEVMKPLLQFSLAITVIGVAAKTLLAQTKQQTMAQHGLLMLSNAQVRSEINHVESAKLLNMMSLMGLETEEMKQKLMKNQTILNAHNVNLRIQELNALVMMSKVYNATNAAQLNYFALNNNMSNQTLRNLQAQLAGELAIIDATRGKLQSKQAELQMKKAEMEMEMITYGISSTASSVERQESVIRQQNLQKEIDLLLMEIQLGIFKIDVLEHEGMQTFLTAKNRHHLVQIMDADTRASLQNTIAKMLNADAEEQGNWGRLQKIDLQELSIMLDDIETRGTLGLADAEMLLDRVRKQSMVTQGNLMKVSMMASVALMGASFIVGVIADESTKAEAQMILMTLAFVPMIAMTIAATVAMLNFTWVMAGATLGISLILAGLAIYAAKKSDLFGSSELDDDLANIERELAENERALQEMQAEHEKMQKQLEDDMSGIEDFTKTLADGEKAMDSFSDKRLDLFFGGKRSSMDAALFNELKQNGVENLYFAPELFVTNNFSGVTYEEAAELVMDAIEERLKDSGTLQMAALHGQATALTMGAQGMGV